MKGFVPVTKENLLNMIDNCHLEAIREYEELLKHCVNKRIEEERRRSSTRKWYRLFILPKPRFSFDQKGAVDFYNSLSYGLFDCSPFTALDNSLADVHKELDRLERLGISQSAEEPIQISIKNFLRLDAPNKYRWVTTYSYWTSRFR